MTIFFLKKSHCDVDLDPITMKRELFRGIDIPNTCVKLYRNWTINEANIAMTLFFFLKTVTVTLTLALERSNSNLCTILSY